jgi:hypothetical protein
LGRITYDAQGRMSAQLMQRDRKDWPSVEGFIAYYGAFDVDAAQGGMLKLVWERQ